MALTVLHQQLVLQLHSMLKWHIAWPVTTPQMAVPLGSSKLRVQLLRLHAQVTTIDQATAESGQEPLKTLSTFRAGHLLGWGALPSWKNAVFVGWNLCTKQAGSLAVGDSIQVTKKRTQTPQRVS